MLLAHASGLSEPVCLRGGSSGGYAVPLLPLTLAC